MNDDQLFPQETIARLKAENDLLRNRIGAVEDMMHPGYWSAYDSRRVKILEAIGSERQVWDGSTPLAHREPTYKLDIFNGVREVYDAWNIPGNTPEYHRLNQNTLRVGWPVLAQALDGLKSLASATDSYSAQPTVLAKRFTFGNVSGRTSTSGATLSSSGPGELPATSSSSAAKAAREKSRNSFRSLIRRVDEPETKL